MLPFANLVSHASASCQRHSAPLTNLSSFPSFSHLLMGGKQPGCLWNARERRSGSFPGLTLMLSWEGLLPEQGCSVVTSAPPGSSHSLSELFEWLCSWTHLGADLVLKQQFPTMCQSVFFFQLGRVPHPIQHRITAAGWECAAEVTLAISAGSEGTRNHTIID